MSDSPSDSSTAATPGRRSAPVGLFLLALALTIALPPVLEALLLEFGRYRGTTPGMLARTSGLTALVLGLTALALWRAGGLRSPSARWTHPATKRVTLGAALVVCGTLTLLSRVNLPREFSAPMRVLSPLEAFSPRLESWAGSMLAIVVLILGIAIGELVFRGWLLDMMREQVGDDTAAAAQAVAYAGLVWPLGRWELGLVVGVVTGVLRLHTGSLLPGSVAVGVYGFWAFARLLVMVHFAWTGSAELVAFVAPPMGVLVIASAVTVSVGLWWSRPAWQATGRGARMVFAGVGAALLVRALVVAFQTAPAPPPVILS